MANFPQEDWLASPTGPDTRQADMVPRWKVLALLEAMQGTPLDPQGDELEWLIEQVKSL